MTKVRAWLSPEKRGIIYTVTGSLVAALVTFGFISASFAPALIGVLLGAVALVYAIVHSESNIRSVIYGLCAAIGVLLVTIGTFTADETEALLAIAAPVLGITLAAAKTPSKIEEVGWVPASE